jgi:hypothetical protein
VTRRWLVCVTALLPNTVELFNALRTGVTTLTHRQAVALAGELYRDVIAASSDEPLIAEGTSQPVGFASAIYRDMIAAFSDEPMIADGTTLTPDM